MGRCRIFPGVVAALGMLILILDSKTALYGAAEGIDLCLRTVVPSLFPFFLLSGILVKSLMGTNLPLLRPVGRLLGIPKGAESLLISGFLGGYPVGAKSIRDAWNRGEISKQDAERMLWFSCNAGPAFLFGMAGPLFSSAGSAWILWSIHIVSTLLIGCFLPGKSENNATMSEDGSFNLSLFLMDAIKVITQVCGWILFFRVLMAFLGRWFLWFLPDWLQVAVTGILELSNGCLELGNIDSEPIRFLLCSGMLSFGGCCVALQTMSVTQGLSLRGYFLGKLLQTGISLLLCLIYLRILSPIWLLTIPFAAIWKKNGKNSSIPAALRV